ncbi:hypothetical protein BVI1335_1010095 [Burkholderia vietnamiensis]|nr:hypothetical protein BVI1335_1010095 [Burkholderia vietnamiensis]
MSAEPELMMVSRYSNASEYINARSGRIV